MDKLDSLIKQHVDDGVEAVAVPQNALRKAKALMGEQGIHCPHCGKAVTPFKTPYRRQKWVNRGWLVAAGATLALSFFWPRYFLQFIGLMLLFGFKWAFNERSTKTQVLIYKALEQEEGPDRLKGLQKHTSSL